MTDQNGRNKLIEALAPHRVVSAHLAERGVSITVDSTSTVIAGPADVIADAILDAGYRLAPAPSPEQVKAAVEASRKVTRLRCDGTGRNPDHLRDCDDCKGLHLRVVHAVIAALGVSSE